MSLNVTAYKMVTLVRKMNVADYCDNTDAQSLVDKRRHVYLYQDGVRSQSDGMHDGIYAVRGQILTLDAGDYRTYGVWRDWLSLTMLGKPAETVWSMQDNKHLPFARLIDFSDCGGFLGPATCIRLARDFAEHEGKVGRGEVGKTYRKWMKLFMHAAGLGVVKFH